MACPTNSSKWKISYNGAIIAHLTNVRFGVQHATRDTTDKDTGRYASFCEGRLTGSGQGDFNVYPGANLGLAGMMTALVGDNPGQLQFINQESGQQLSGDAWITDLSLDAPGDNQNTTGSVQFQLTGQFNHSL